MAVPEELLPLQDRKMVLCLPCGDGTVAAALRAGGTPTVGLDPDDVAVANCRQRGVPAWSVPPQQLAHHRHKFDGAFVDLDGLDGTTHGDWATALGESVRPGGILVLHGDGAKPFATAANASILHEGPNAVARRQPQAIAASPCYPVARYADPFVGRTRVLVPGCGSGRFLDALALREVKARGVEPHADLAAAARARGHEVCVGGLPAVAQFTECDGVFLGPWLGALPEAHWPLLLRTCRNAMRPRSPFVARLTKRRAPALVALLTPPDWSKSLSTPVPGDADDLLVVAFAGDVRPGHERPLPDVPLPTRDQPVDAPLRSLYDLERFEHRVHSQGGEDGVLAALFAHMGTTNRHYVEFGCGDGVQCNTAALRRAGWQGLLMDGACAPGAPDACIQQAWITAENINGLFDHHGVPQEPDLMSIDLDGNDYWVWRAIARRPRVVIAEYNANLAADRALTIAYDPEHHWDGSDHYGASLLALAQLGRRKGYTLVYCTQAGVNAFFVRDDLVRGEPAIDPVALYRPPNYWYRGARSVPYLSRAMVSV